MSNGKEVSDGLFIVLPNSLMWRCVIAYRQGVMLSLPTFPIVVAALVGAEI